MSKIKYGDVPDYILPLELFKNTNILKLDTYIQELCCDEYIEYLKMIPKSYTSKNSTSLLSSCAKNGSIICTEYIINFNKLKISEFIKTLFVASVENNKEEYFNWLISKPEINIIKNTDIEKTNIWTALILNNNLKMFLKIVSIIELENMTLINMLSLSYSHENLIFCDILYEILSQKNISDFDTKLKKIFTRTNTDFKTYIWLYEIIKNSLTSEDINLIFKKPVCNFEILEHIEKKFNPDNEKYKNILYKMIDDNYYTYHLFGNDWVGINIGKQVNDDELKKNIIIYLYSKCEFDFDSKKEFYEKIRLKYKNNRKKFLKDVGYFLIDDIDIQIDNFKDIFYEYYNYKKSIENKQYRTKFGI
jgi:hypothetical protein